MPGTAARNYRAAKVHSADMTSLSDAEKLAFLPSSIYHREAEKPQNSGNCITARPPGDAQKRQKSDGFTLQADAALSLSRHCRRVGCGLVSRQTQPLHLGKGLLSDRDNLSFDLLQMFQRGDQGPLEPLSVS